MLSVNSVSKCALSELMYSDGFVLMTEIIEVLRIYFGKLKEGI